MIVNFGFKLIMKIIIIFLVYTELKDGMFYKLDYYCYNKKELYTDNGYEINKNDACNKINKNAKQYNFVYVVRNNINSVIFCINKNMPAREMPT